MLTNVYNAKIKNAKVKIPDITKSPTNNTLSAKINEAKNENAIPSITNLATTVALNAKINDIKKISNITNLATTTAFNVFENKIPNHS